MSAQRTTKPGQVAGGPADIDHPEGAAPDYDPGPAPFLCFWNRRPPMDAPKRDKLMNFRVREHEAELYRLAARCERETLSEWIRKVLAAAARKVVR
jgi:hypothetical protein